jgi:hypothetical protein
MTYGSLDIYWENCADVAATPHYRLNFLPLRGAQVALGSQELVGDEALLDYLATMQDTIISLEIRKQQAQEWLLQLHNATTLSLLVTLSESQLEGFCL